MSSRPGERAGWRAAERGAGRAEAAVPGRGLPGTLGAPLSAHFARLPTSRRWGRPRSAPHACPRRAGAGAGEGGTWLAERRRRRRGGGSWGWGGGGFAPRRPRAPPPPPARLRIPDAPPPGGRCPGRRSHRRQTGRRRRRTSPRAGFSGFVFASCLYPLSESRWGRGRSWARGALKFALPSRGPWRAASAAEQVTPGSGLRELLNGRFPRCLLPTVFPPRRSPLFFSLQSLFFLFPFLLSFLRVTSSQSPAFYPHSTFLWESAPDFGVLSVDPLRRRDWGDISQLPAANTALASVLSRVPRRFLTSPPPSPPQPWSLQNLLWHSENKGQGSGVDNRAIRASCLGLDIL